MSARACLTGYIHPVILSTTICVLCGLVFLFIFCGDIDDLLLKVVVELACLIYALADVVVI